MKPITVSINITNKCNLLCRHCSANSSISSCNLMSEDQLLFIANLLKNNSIFSVEITGGEPFCSPYLSSFIRNLNSWQIVRVRTNGTLITENRLKDIRKENIAFIISIDGNQKIHDSIRGKGAFERALSGIKKLILAGYPVGISMTLMRSNYLSLLDVIPFLASLGVSDFSITGCHAVGRAEKNAESIDGEQYLEFLSIYQEFIKNSNISVALSTPTNIDSDKKNAVVHNCSAGFESLTITCTGDVIPCNALQSWSCGNIFIENFNNICDNSKRLKEFRKLRDLRTAELNDCQFCTHNEYCSSGCRADAYAESGSFFNKSVSYCEVFNKILEAKIHI